MTSGGLRVFRFYAPPPKLLTAAPAGTMLWNAGISALRIRPVSIVNCNKGQTMRASYYLHIMGGCKLLGPTGAATFSSGF